VIQFWVAVTAAYWAALLREVPVVEVPRLRLVAR
jgi:hypothetical protein